MSLTAANTICIDGMEMRQDHDEQISARLVPQHFERCIAHTNRVLLAETILPAWNFGGFTIRDGFFTANPSDD